MSKREKSSKIMQWIVSVCCMAVIVMLSVVEPIPATVDDEASTYTAGAPVYFTKAFVDSNSYTYITSNTMTMYKEYADVKVTNIYKADGSASDYKYVWVKATPDGDPVKVKLGDSWTQISIPSANRFAGMNVSMHAKGNDPSLDCKITGSWLVY